MKFLSRFKTLIVIGVVTLGLMGVVTLVSATNRIATITFGDSEPVKIDSANPSLGVFINEVNELEIKVSDYQTDGLNIKFKGQEFTNYTIEGGVIKLSVSKDEIGEDDNTHYLNFKNSDEKEFKIGITVDNTDPTIKLKLGENEVDVDHLDGYYNANILTVEVEDKNFNPLNPENFDVLGGTMQGEWSQNGDKWSAQFFYADGSHKIDVMVKDMAGNKANPVSQKRFVIDTIDPTVTIETNGADESEDVKYTNSALTIKVDDKNYSAGNTEVKVNEEVVSLEENDTNPGEFFLNLDSYVDVDGVIKVSVSTKDKAGNETNSEFNNIILDTTKPLIQSITFNDVKVNKGVNIFDGEQTVKIVINEKYLKEANVTIKDIKEQLKQGARDITWNKDGDLHTGTFIVKEDGEYDLLINALDKAENKMDEYTVGFMIDSKAPDIEFKNIAGSQPVRIENNDVYSALKGKVEITEANHKNTEYTLTKKTQGINEPPKDVSSKVTVDKSKKNLEFTINEEGEEGEYKLTITATDKAGKIKSEERTFFIDNTAPVVDSVSIAESIKNCDVSCYDKDPELIFSIKDLNISQDNINLMVTRDSEKHDPWTEIHWESTSNNTYTASVSFPQDGLYSIALKGTDKAGNSFLIDDKFNKLNNLSFIVDRTAPTIKFEGIEDNMISSDNQTLTITAEDLTFEKGSYLIQRVTYEDGKLITSEKTGELENNIPLKEEFTEEGDYYLKVTVSDKFDRITTEEINFSIDKTAPIVKGYTFEEAKAIKEGIHYYDEGQIVTLVIDEPNFDFTKLDLNVTRETYDVEKQMWNADENFNLGELKWTTQNGYTLSLQIPLENHGKYTVSVKSAIDQVENATDSKNLPEDLTLIVDTTDPKVDLLGVEALINEDQTLNVTVKDDTFKEVLYLIEKIDYLTEKMECSVKEIKAQDSEVERSTEANFDLPTFKEDGKYCVRTTAIDMVEHKTSSAIEFTIDKIAPVVEAYDMVKPVRIDGQGVKYYNAGQTIGITIDEYHFNAANPIINLTHQSSLNSEDVKNVEVNPSWVKQEGTVDKYHAEITLPNDGYYQLLSVDYTDEARNQVAERPELEKIVIDTVKPVIHAVDVTEEFYYKKGDAVTINVSIEETNFNPELSTYTIYRKDTIDGAEYTYKSGNITSQNGFMLPTLTENGEYRVVLETKDMSNNEAQSVELHFYIDHNNPTVSISSATADGAHLNTSEVILNLSAKDDWKLNDTKYTVIRNNKQIDVAKNGDWEYFTLVFNEEGYYQIALETSDEAGNATVKETYEFTIDRTTPESLTITGNSNHHGVTTAIENEGSYSTPAVNLDFSVEDFYSFETIALNVLKDGGHFLNEVINVKSARNNFDAIFGTTTSHTLDAEGEYQVTFTTTDQAGNKNEETISFEIDRTAPVIESNIEDEKYYNDDFLPEFTLDKPERDEFTYINIDGVNYKGRNMLLATDKVYTFDVLATDKAQNTTEYTASLTVDKTAPTIVISNLITGFFKDTLEPSIFYQDTNLDSSQVSIKLNGVELGQGIGDESGYTKTVNIDKDGTYVLDITIGDLATNISNQTIDFVLDNESPVIAIKNPITLYNQPWLPELEVLEEYGYDIVMATLNGVEYDITQPITNEGKNVLFIEVMDKSGNVSSITVQFILDMTPPKVIIENAETNQVVKDGERYLTKLDLKIYLDYISQEGQQDTERITGITLNGESVTDSVEMENGRKVYRLSLTEFKDYTLEVKAVDDAQNVTVETINFKLADKTIFTKFYENKPLFYSTMTVLVLGGLGAGVYLIKKPKTIVTKEESSKNQN